MFGNLVPAIVVGNADWRDQSAQQMNFWATAAWHFVSKAKGKALVSIITGPVAIFSGDDDFMDMVLSS